MALRAEEPDTKDDVMSSVGEITDRVNNYIAEAGEYETKGDFESAILAYEMGLHSYLSNFRLVRGMYGCLENLRHKMIKEGASEEDIDHVQEYINDLEVKYDIPINIQWSLREVVARNIIHKGDDKKREGEIIDAAVMYFAATKIDSSNIDALNRAYSCFCLIREHMEDSGAPNAELQEIDDFMEEHGIQPIP